MTQPVDYLAKLAAAKTLCKGCAGDGKACRRHKHGCCDSTGLAWLIPDSAGVRVADAPSKGGVIWSHVDCKSLGHCDIADTMPAFEDCHGLGYTVSHDQATWGKALWEMLSKYVQESYVTLSGFIVIVDPIALRQPFLSYWKAAVRGDLDGQGKFAWQTLGAAGVVKEVL